MLSGESRQSSGSAHPAGLDLLTDVHKCRRYIGATSCSQEIRRDTCCRNGDFNTAAPDFEMTS